MVKEVWELGEARRLDSNGHQQLQEEVIDK